MTVPRTIPNDSTYDVVSFDLLTGGKVVDPGYQILAISILKEVNRIPTAKIEIIDGEAADETFEISNTDDFLPGKDIQIKVGRDGKNTTVFKGIIVKQSVKVKNNGNASLCIECKDLSVKLTIGRHSQYFDEKKDSEVFDEIIGKYAGLESDVEVTKLKHKELVQFHTSDWDFIVSRAEANGKLVIIDDGKISIKQPDTSQKPILSLLYGNTILEFHAEMDARTQWKKVSARGWDYKNQALFTSQTDSVSLAEPGNISGEKLANTIGLGDLEMLHSGHVIEEELTEWVNACMLKSRLAKIRGRAKIMVGFTPIKPGQIVELNGVGSRFSGKAFVSAVRHDIGGGEWDTNIQFGLSPKWFTQKEDIADISAGGLIPSISGLHIGKTVQLESDPDGEDRILVKIPVLDNEAKGIWARVATLDAGENRGSFFRPEIDDEVIIGFINDDPRDAIVLGMLNSSAKPAPIIASDDNHEKGFVTRSEMKLLFNDDKKTITIATPAGNSIVISEDDTSIIIKDQNDNILTMNKDGVAIDTPKDIKMTAKGNIELKASMDIKINGLNVSLTADTALSAKGQASAAFESSGPTLLKGLPININ